MDIPPFSAYFHPTSGCGFWFPEGVEVDKWVRCKPSHAPLFAQTRGRFLRNLSCSFVREFHESLAANIKKKKIAFHEQPNFYEPSFCLPLVLKAIGCWKKPNKSLINPIRPRASRQTGSNKIIFIGTKKVSIKTLWCEKWFGFFWHAHDCRETGK